MGFSEWHLAWLIKVTLMNHTRDVEISCVVCARGTIEKWNSTFIKYPLVCVPKTACPSLCDCKAVDSARPETPALEHEVSGNHPQ